MFSRASNCYPIIRSTDYFSVPNNPDICVVRIDLTHCAHCSNGNAHMNAHACAHAARHILESSKVGPFEANFILRT